MWQGWYDFSELFEVRPIVSDESKSNIKLTVNGDSGFLTQDSGFFLRKNQDDLVKGTTGIYFLKITAMKDAEVAYIGRCWEAKNGLVKRLVDHFRKIIAIPHRGEILGLHHSPGGFDWQKAYPDKKLREKERALVRESLAEMSFDSYRSCSEYFLDQGAKLEVNFLENYKKMIEFGISLETYTDIKSFFENHVKIAFVKIPSNRKNSNIDIGKAEGLALLSYKHAKGHYPVLNSSNECRTNDDFDKLL